MPAQKIIAVDIGAESGRVIVATIDHGRVELDLINRFANIPKTIDGGLRWDVPSLFAGIEEGLTKAAAEHGAGITSIGIDTWGVDYALLDERDQLVEQPFCYRDKRTEKIRDEIWVTVPDAEIYRRTGIQSLVINTSYQLAAHARSRPESLKRAKRMLCMPDYLHFWLSGEKANEQTFASTTQLCKHGAKEWDLELIRMMGIPAHLFGAIKPAGTTLGRLRKELADKLGFTTPPKIVLPGSHDTASAVAAVPGDPQTTSYISSGTWSLMGMQGQGPIASETARQRGFSNEIAVDGTARPLKNIMGLWVVQECRRALVRAGRERSYPELTALATAAKPMDIVLDVDDPRFLHSSVDSDEMPSRIAAWCRERNVAAPTDDGQLIRFVLDGLVAAYRRCHQDLEELSGRHFDAIHVVGGGGENTLLCQLTANACARPVIAGPAEATALGNVLVQAVATGAVASAAEARAMLGRSLTLKRYESVARSGRNGES